MSFLTAKYIPLADKKGPILTGGLITNSEPWMIPYPNSPDAQNFRVNGRGISPRPGFYQFGDDFNTTEHGRGLGIYYRASVTNDRLVVRYNYSGTQKLVTVKPSDGTQAQITTGSLIASDNRMYFIGANDSLYCMNGADAFGKLYDTTYTNPSTGTPNTVTHTVGAGLSDLTSATAYTPVHTYTIKIDTTGTPDKFTWSVDGGTPTTGVSITGSNQVLGGGVTIKFGATTGHTLNDTWTVTTGLAPAFGAWFDNSLWVAGDPRYPNRLFKSAENDPSIFTGSGSDIFDSPYPITGLASAGQTLYVFSENNIDMINNNSIKQIGSSLVYTSIPLEASEGALNHYCIAVFGRDVYYLSKSLKIKQVKPNGMLHYDVIELTHRPNRGIDEIMAGLTADQSNSFCYVIPEANLMKWHLQSKGSTVNDVCVVYNTAYDEFMKDTNKLFIGGVNYKTQNFTISQLEPKIYKDETGYEDDGSPTQFVYASKFLTFGDPTINKDVWQARTFLSANAYCEGLKQEISKDGNVINTRILKDADIPNLYGGIATKPFGTYPIGTEGAIQELPQENITLVVDKGYLNHRGKYFQVKWSIGKIGANFLLQYFGMKAEMKDQLTTSTR